MVTTLPALLKISPKQDNLLKFTACFQHQQEVDLSGGMREMELGYQQNRDFAAQMPFTFRVQPSHPNLQEDK